MIFSAHKNLGESVIGYLQKGPLFTGELLKFLQKKRPRTTKQGMYAVLRKLIQAEVVLKHKKQISLNVTWLTKVESFVTLAEHFYASASRSGSFLSLADGENIRYEFHNTNATDAFWIHVLLLLVEAHPRQPWFGYNPHDWFFVARAESERALRDFLVKKGGQYLMVVGSKRPLDKLIRKEFDGKRSQYFMRETPMFPQNNYYVNIIGDYIIEVWIDTAQAKAIERLYATATEATTEVVKQLQDIIRSKGKTKFVVSRNKKKAGALRAKLSNPFYIPKRD